MEYINIEDIQEFFATRGLILSTEKNAKGFAIVISEKTKDTGAIVRLSTSKDDLQEALKEVLIESLFIYVTSCAFPAKAMFDVKLQQ